MEVGLPPSLWFQDLVCKAVRDLGGSAANEAIFEKAIEIGQFSEEQLALLPPPDEDGGLASRVHFEILAALRQAAADARLAAAGDDGWTTAGNTGRVS
jgi:hypothetical protein